MKQYKLRLPIQTGASSAGNLVRFGMAIFPIAFISISFIVGETSPVAAAIIQFANNYILDSKLLVVTLLVLLVLSCFHMAAVIRGLPSDLLVDDEGMTVRTLFKKRHWYWNELRPNHCHTVLADERRKSLWSFAFSLFRSYVNRRYGNDTVDQEMVNFDDPDMWSYPKQSNVGLTRGDSSTTAPLKTENSTENFEAAPSPIWSHLSLNGANHAADDEMANVDDPNMWTYQKDTETETDNQVSLTIEKEIDARNFKNSIEDPYSDISRKNIYHLVIPTVTDEQIFLGTTDAGSEATSLEALRDTIRSFGDTNEPPPEPLTVQAVLRCKTCGAPVAPKALPSTPCESCGTDVAISNDVQRRVLDATRRNEDERDTEDAVRSLFNQKDSRTTTLTLLMWALLFLVVWPTIWSIWFLKFVDDAQNILGHMSVYVGSLASFSFLGYAAIRKRISQRGALRLLTLNFASQTDSTSDNHYCRVCAATLECSESDVLVTCRYCSSTNITSADLRRQVAPVDEPAASINEILENRRSEQQSWHRQMVLAAVGCVVLIVIAAV